MIIAGIDYSMNGPCICIFVSTENETFLFERCRFHFLTDTHRYSAVFLNNIFGDRFQDYNHECERYKSIADWSMDMIMGCEQVALEDYSYNSKGKVFHIAENTGILKYKLYNAGIPVDVISPASIKKFATGKGNAKKEDMHTAFMKETRHNLKTIITPKKKNVSSPVSDIVDSYYVCKYLYNDIIKYQTS